MNFSRSVCFAAISALALSACGGSGGAQGSRDFVRAVGSSTIYPFATAVAERVAQEGGRSPIVESTGTGGGMKLFCAGIGASHPDIVNGSRRMKASEYNTCAQNGVDEVVEVQIGIDGIAFAQPQSGPDLRLTPEDIYKALAANPYGERNTTTTWRDVNPALPDVPILVYGPPSTSGTREALEELILMVGCEANPAMAELKETDEDRFDAVCTQIREDGGYVDGGENDNLIVQKIAQNPRAIGVFGYSFLEANADVLRGVPISGVEPTYEAVSNFSYPGARPLYIYIKKGHLNAIQSLRPYAAEWANAWGADGYLRQHGMVVSPQDVRERNARIIADMTPLDPTELQ